MARDERWLPVVGYEGVYEVSDQGRVKRVKPGKSTAVGRILKGIKSPKGYVRVFLYRDGEGQLHSIHRLVLAAFVGPSPLNMEACHGPDRDPSNNRLDNLRWDTREENQRDKVRHGTNHEANKTHCPQGHEYAGENLAILKRGWRKCRECHRERERNRYARKRDHLLRSKEPVA